MDYKVLDVEKNPSNQGFSPGEFDIILAANVLHATSNMSKTLQYVNWLLKPGGHLILFEATLPDSVRTSFIAGLLPGWWLSTDTRRKYGPLLDEEGWVEELQTNGFTGLDFVVHDDDQAHQAFSLLMSRKTAPKFTRQADDPPLVIIASAESPLQQDVLRQTRKALTALDQAQVISVDFEQCSWNVPAGSTCIFLPELEQNVTSRMSTALLSKFQSVLTSCSRIVWFATRADTDTDPLNGVAVGLLRTLQSEHHDLQYAHLEIEAPQDQHSISNKLLQTLGAFPASLRSPFAEEYKEIDGILHVNRIVPCTETDRILRPVHGRRTAQRWEDLQSQGINYSSLTTLEPGQLESLQFIANENSLQPMADDEIEIEVRATGLNFRDVLVALGQIDDDFFGFECAGVVRRRGSAAGDLNVGDKVVCLAQGTFATTIRCLATAAVKLSSNMPMHIAAGIPLVGTTAHYALVHLARIASGESVLIHSGAGGLGQAAIMVAQAHDAVIYTTVGTDEKRDFLAEKYKIPREHILCSRTLAFSDKLHALTKGRGVDVVLNSLSGEGLRASWKCLAPFGRFLETGKRDILSFGQLPMSMFADNRSFMGVDLAQIIKTNPSLTGRLLREVMQLAEVGTLSISKPVHRFNSGEVEAAFRFLQNSKNHGKVVVEFKDTDLVPIGSAPSRQWRFDPCATYLIAGGLGGLGRSLARWMAAQGARNLILLSRRSQHGLEVQQLLQDLFKQDVTVATPPCDISDVEKLRKLLNEHSHMGPVKGCIQLSMVLHEAEFHNLTHDMIAESLKPKVDGSWNLHQLLPKTMDFFVMFSSIAGITGTPGMTAYNMGNVFQDELARWRTQRQLKTMSVDLGAVTNAGYVAENQLLPGLRRMGAADVTDGDIHAFLAYFCDPQLSIASSGQVQTIVGLKNLESLRAAGIEGGPWYQRQLFTCMNALRTGSRELETDTENPDIAENVIKMLRASRSPEEAAAVVVRGIVGKLSAMLGMDSATIDTTQPLQAFGIDSLVAIEIRNWFRRAAGANVSILELLGNTSIADLAVMVATRSNVGQ